MVEITLCEFLLWLDWTSNPNWPKGLRYYVVVTTPDFEVVIPFCDSVLSEKKLFKCTLTSCVFIAWFSISVFNAWFSISLFAFSSSLLRYLPALRKSRVSFCELCILPRLLDLLFLPNRILKPSDSSLIHHRILLSRLLPSLSALVEDIFACRLTDRSS